MSMSITIRNVDDVMVLAVSGRLTLGDGVNSLRQAVQNEIRAGHRKILLNLGSTTYVDSSGLGELVASFSQVSNLSGEMKLVHVTKRVQDLLLVTKLYSVFDIYDDEAAAIKSFSISTLA